MFDNDKLISCPYNRTHRFAAYKLHDHLMRCKEGIKSTEKLYFCKGNSFICFVGENERYDHLKKCKLCNGINKITNENKNVIEVDKNNDSYTMLNNSNIDGFVNNLHSQEHYFQKLNDPEVLDEYIKDYKERRENEKKLNVKEKEKDIMAACTKNNKKDYEEDRVNNNFTMNVSKNDSIKYVNDTWFEQTNILNRSELETLSFIDKNQFDDKTKLY